MFLGIDLGTSELKVLLVDGNGSIVGTARQALGISRPKPRWSEQDPDDWWRATQAALFALRTNHADAYARVRAIGLSGQMHGAVLLDARNRPLRGAILWNDTRSIAECEELAKRVPRLQEIAGNAAMPGLTAPKLLWVARHEPEHFRKLSCVVLPKDYLRLRLTGSRLTDLSDASGTLWLDIARREWSDALLAACDMTRAQVPPAIEAGQPGAALLPAVARELGLPLDTIVAAGAGDTATSALGIGAVEAGEGFVSLGTSGVVSIVADRFRPHSHPGVHAVCHAVPERWHRTSVVLSAASCLRWVCKLTSADETTLLTEVERSHPDDRARAPLFLPYLSGERTPHNDPYAQGVFFGLADSSDRGALAYAVLEGVTFALRDGLDVLGSDAAVATRFGLIGGGARSAFWAQLLADVFAMPIRRQKHTESVAALGAARLGMLAAGMDLPSAIRSSHDWEEFIPDAARHALLSERRTSFKRLYPHLRPMFRQFPR